MLMGATMKLHGTWQVSAAQSSAAAAKSMAPLFLSCGRSKRRARMLVVQASSTDSNNNNSIEASSHMAMTRADLEACQWLRPTQEPQAASSHKTMDHAYPSFISSPPSPASPSSINDRAAHSSGSAPKHSILVDSIYSSFSSDAVLPLSWQERAETGIERAIFDFRFLSLLAIVGSLAGSCLCFLKGCVFVAESYGTFYSMCLNGVHTGKMVLRLVEAVGRRASVLCCGSPWKLGWRQTLSPDVYLTGTVMLIFGMGLYGLFISNVANNVPPSEDRALKNSSLFGMFLLQERPKWMRIGSLDELKTKLGHVVVMILLVKMFERSKGITIATSVDLLSYSISIFLTSAALLVLHKLHH